MLGHSVNIFISQCTYFAPHTEYYLDTHLQLLQLVMVAALGLVQGDQIGVPGKGGGSVNVRRIDTEHEHFRRT